MDDIKKLLEFYKEGDRKGGFRSELQVRQAIREFVAKNDIKKPFKELIAEQMAFDFKHDYREENEEGQTYYAPIFIGKNEAGQLVEYPSIKKVDADIIRYWEKRAQEENFSLLKGRYADLVWDFSHMVCGISSDVSYPRIAIDSYLSIAENDIYEYPIDVIKKLERALSLSISINDTERITKTKTTILNFEERVAIDDKPGLWGFVYELLIDNDGSQQTNGDVWFRLGSPTPATLTTGAGAFKRHQSGRRGRHQENGA